jgi:hypothetical protein
MCTSKAKKLNTQWKKKEFQLFRIEELSFKKWGTGIEDGPIH